jgi:hypothetical protein
MSSRRHKIAYFLNTLIQEFYVLLTLRLGIIFVNKQLDAQFFFHVCLFLFSTCFGAAMCPSSGELIVSIRHLVYVTVYRWPFGVGLDESHPNLHTKRSHIQSDIYQMSYWYNSPDDGHIAVPKHVSNRNKRTWRRTVRQVGYLQALSWFNFIYSIFEMRNPMWWAGNVVIIWTRPVIKSCHICHSFLWPVT